MANWTQYTLGEVGLVSLSSTQWLSLESVVEVNDPIEVG